MTRSQANLLLLAVALIWGAAFVGQAWGMADVGPLTFTGVRFALGAAVVAPWAWRESRAQARSSRAPGGSVWGQIGLLGGLVFLGAALQQIGMLSASVTHAGFLTALYVPLVPLLSWAMFGLTPHWSAWPAALGCLLGTWLLAGGPALAASGGLSSGDAWIIASSLPWALHVLFVGRAAQRGIGVYRLACGQFAVCAVLGLALGGWLEPQSLAGLGKAWGSIAYTGLVSVGVGYTLQVVAQQHARASDCAIILSAETVFAAAFGALFMGDRLGATGIAGCALILACIIGVQLESLWPRRLARRRVAEERATP